MGATTAGYPLTDDMTASMLIPIEYQNSNLDRVSASS